MTTAEKFAELVPNLSPRVWARGGRVRVYVHYPSGYEGGAGGGGLGYVDFSRGVSYRGLSAPDDLLEQIKAAVAEVA